MKKYVGQGPKQRNVCPCGAWGPAWWPEEPMWKPISPHRNSEKGSQLIGYY